MESGDFTIADTDGSIGLHLKMQRYPLELRSAFGTSHSSTTLRHNVLITVRMENISGYGEVGLPPKKPLCYLADYDDIKKYFSDFLHWLPSVVANQHARQYDPFDGLPAQYFAGARHSQEELLSVKALRVLFRALDTCPQNTEATYKAARSGIEAALLDAWCKIRKQYLWQFLGVPPELKACFYTAGLDEIPKMVEGTRHALTMTPHLKIKLDSDIEKSKNILQALRELYNKEGVRPGYHWSVDANSAWSWETAEKFVELLRPYKGLIYMVEQPFDVDFLNKDVAHLDKWRLLKDAFGKEGMLVYADESFAGAQDVERLRPYVHGVNVKLEKTGGFRAAVKAIEAARSAGLKVWVGMMVGSLLLSSMPAHLLPLTDVGGDLDGSMWVLPQANLFDLGYTPRGDGMIDLAALRDPSAYGNGVVLKHAS